MLASQFLTAVRRQGQFPADLADASILAAGDMEIQGRLVPLIRQVHAEYFVAEAQLASQNGRVALPERSVAGSVRHVQLISGGQAVNLPQMQLEADTLTGGSGIPFGWYFDGGQVVLLPRGTEGTIRFRYYVRPSAMTSAADEFVRVGDVAVSASGSVLTLDSAAPEPTPFAPLDVISNRGSHNLLALDQPSTASLSMTVPNASLLGPISPGDYVALAGFTPVVPLPEELFAALVHQTAATLLRALGYESEAKAQSVFAETALGQAQTLLAPRSEGNTLRRVGGIRSAIGQDWQRRR